MVGPILSFLDLDPTLSYLRCLLNQNMQQRLWSGWGTWRAQFFVSLQRLHYTSCNVRITKNKYEYFGAVCSNLSPKCKFKLLSGFQGWIRTSLQRPQHVIEQLAASLINLGIKCLTIYFTVILLFTLIYHIHFTQVDMTCFKWLFCCCFKCLTWKAT